MDAPAEIDGSSVYVSGGTTHEGRAYVFTIADADSFFVGADDITVAQVPTCSRPRQ